MFHLGWFKGNGFGMYGWNVPWGPTNAYEFLSPEFYLDMLRALERAFFDMMIIEDSSYVPEIYQGKRDHYLEKGIGTPKLDPVPLATVLATETKRIGVVPTLSTSEYPPFLLARLLNTLDHVSNGRIGWNIVTGSSHTSAQNYGHEQLTEHDTRYDMADEYVDLVTQLWDAWEPDALVMDKETGTFADPSKVRAVDFEGTYYRSRGPLNSAPSPQGRPFLTQAGGSTRGRNFAARNAETVVANPRGIPAMKAYVRDVAAGLEANGRKRSECKILFMVNPVLGETMDEALDKRERVAAAGRNNLDDRMAAVSRITGVDMSQFDPDEPLPELTTNSHQSSLADLRGDGTRTLRESLTMPGNSSVDLAGTPDAVAAQMGEIIEEVDADGFLLTHPKITRRYISEVTDGLVPALQRRGLTRTSYSHDHLRDNMLEF